MSERDPEVLLDDIRTAIRKIERYCAEMDKEGFLKDEKTADAVVRNLAVIGEAVNRLPDHFRQQHSGIPLGEIAGLRNRVVHDYAGIDFEIIWEVVQHSIPELRDQIDDLM